ncbi:hypothetical protein K1S05_27755, partial [Klebsiella pneumoniae]|nr:hypothetical protein [Klebsiella pneumoniae]MCA4960252.1 hypothetical protein [Klebsiella pneumoniae]MCA5281269.1 hypothetical protein [Klebsiella pneumoniae]MCA5297045.1 hypothetical protein [Klebsiella pneumoniae]MCA5323567.1 hypothetical protein [Klebsiella pneumoniae]
MENIALIGIDLGKNSFHIHCQDHRGKAVYRKKFTRPKRHCCKVSDEAAFCLIQRPYISKTLLTRRISPRG